MNADGSPTIPPNLQAVSATEEASRYLAGPAVTPRLLTRAEAAQYLNVSESTVKRMVQDHGLPYVTLGGQTRWDRADLDSWIEQQKNRNRRRR